jgi:hypothetical protein
MHLHFILGCIVILIIVLYFSTPIRNEAFGMSPGTMDQLSSTRSPTFIPTLVDSFVDTPKVNLKDPNRKPDQAMDDAIQANLAKKGIHDMTEITSYPREYAPA